MIVTTFKNTPNCELANIITDALISEGLVSEERHNDVLAAIIDGSIKQANWKLYIKIPIIQSEQEERNVEPNK
jgi:hypothetical protein